MKRENVRLNNFILWCKNWYQPINKDMPIFEQAKAALYIDDYICIKTNNDVLNVVMTFIDDLVDAKLIQPFRMQIFYNDVKKNKHWYKLTDDESLLWTIRNYFAYDVERKDLKLNPPTYNKKIYKLGFVGPSHMGNSYKMLNYKANKFFSK
ncbi:hypothetical protein J6Q66_05230 [bacterium]|nr:hypothetical protein [bacterium]